MVEYTEAVFLKHGYKITFKDFRTWFSMFIVILKNIHSF